MRQKGSLKDRIRSWKYQKKLQKEKEKREEQEAWEQFVKTKKQQGIYIQPTVKKYNFLQIFLHSLFGFFLGVFEVPKKESTKSSSKLLQEIIELQEEIEKVENPDILPLYYDKLKQKEVLIQQMANDKESTLNAAIKECVERVKVITIKLQKNQSQKETISDFETYNPLQMEEQKKLEQEQLVSTQLRESEKENIQITLENKENINFTQVQSKGFTSPVLEKKQPTFVPIPNFNNLSGEEAEHKKNIVMQKENVIGQKKQSDNSIEQDKYQKYLLNANKKLKKQKEELDKIKEKTKSAKTKTELYQLESAILWIKNQLILMEKEYNEISKEKDFQHLKDQYEYYQLDNKNLLKSNQAICDLLEECQKEIDGLEALTKQPSKGVKKVQEKEQKKEKRVKKEKTEEFYLDVEDFEKLRNQIREDLNRQLEEMKAIPLMPTPVVTHPNGFFSRTINFISTTVLVLTPMVFFKNRLTGMLTSSILVHNRILTMRQIVERKEVVYETGENLFTNIHSKQDCLNAIRMHLSESLIELEQIKQSFINKYQSLYPTETESILIQLRSLESQIMERAMLIQMNQSKLLQMKQKYQKTLKK